MQSIIYFVCSVLHLPPAGLVLVLVGRRVWQSLLISDISHRDFEHAMTVERCLWLSSGVCQFASHHELYIRCHKVYSAQHRLFCLMQSTSFSLCAQYVLLTMCSVGKTASSRGTAYPVIESVSFSKVGSYVPFDFVAGRLKSTQSVFSFIHP